MAFRGLDAVLFETGCARAMRLARALYLARFGIFFKCPRMLQIGAIGKALDAIYQAFSGLYPLAIWIKKLWFEGLCLIQPRQGRIAAPGVYGAAYYQNYRSLGVQRRAE